jgi:3-hydroxybutyryl-CoA dehydrogenase
MTSATQPDDGCAPAALVSQRTAVVVGAGTMGTGVAAAFLSHGWKVELVEPDVATLASATTRISALLQPAASAIAAAALRLRSSLAQVDWTGVLFVSENVYEDLEVKRAVFAELQALSPSTVPLTSNSTTIFAVDIARDLPRPQTVLNAHFLMPAHVVPLVEVLATPEVAPSIADTACAVLESIGKKPVRLRTAMRGFLVNRIQSALMREALALVDTGVASPQDVDMAVRLGFGFRYAACGPLLQKEHSGWDISHAMYSAVFPTLSNNTEPPSVITKMVQEGRTGMKRGHGFVRWSPDLEAAERARFNREMQAALTLVSGKPSDPVLEWVGNPAALRNEAAGKV